MHLRKWTREISSLYGLHGGKEKKKCSNPIPPTITWWSSVIGYLIATQLDSLQQKKPSLPLLMDSHELYLKIYDWWCNRDNMIKSRNQWRFWNAIISSGCTKPQNWVWLLRGSLLHSLWLRIKVSALWWKEHNRSQNTELSLTGWKDCWCVMHQKLHLFIYQICQMLILFSFLRWIVSSAQLERRQKDIVQDFRKTSKTTKPGLGGDKPTTKGSTRPFCQLPPGGHFGGVGENMIWSRTLWVPSTLAF